MNQQQLEFAYNQQLAVVKDLETRMKESEKREEILEGKKTRDEINEVRYCNDCCVECDLQEEINEKLTVEVRKLSAIARHVWFSRQQEREEAAAKI